MTKSFGMRVVVLVAAVAAVGVAAAAATAQSAFEVPVTAGTRWFKGNTHSHTLLTDGDSPPEVVVNWYRSRGYGFLVITDHDRVTDPAGLAALVDSGFVLVAGEEVTASFGGKPVHVNGIGLSRVVAPRTEETAAATIQANVDSVRAAGGVPQLNHPNFRWALSEEDIFAVENLTLFELHNGHPLVNNLGGGGVPGTEELWDQLLTRGKRLYGMAADDSHHFTQEFAPARVNPGRAWVVVRSRVLEPSAIARALDEGQFYSSTGVMLEDVVVERDRMEVRIAQSHPDLRYRTQFIGRNGQVLRETHENPAVFTLRGETGYVRAKVFSSDGAVAWVQPVFIRPAR